jgi:hypothetical protein
MITTEKDVLELFVPPTQARVVELAETCLKHYWGKPAFLGYVAAATNEAAAADSTGIRMVILTSIQMGYEKGLKDAAREASVAE